MPALTVYLSDSDYDQLREEAEQRDTSPEDLARSVVEEALLSDRRGRPAGPANRPLL